jgi:hypothetical protein
MATYLLLVTYLLLFTYSTISLHIPVCDCNQPKTRGILDINKPYYCEKGKTNTTHQPRMITTHAGYQTEAYNNLEGMVLSTVGDIQKDSRILLDRIF